MALTQEQIDIMDRLSGAKPAASTPAAKNKIDKNKPLTNKDFDEMDKIVGIKNTPAKPISVQSDFLRDTIQKENPDKFNMWQQKGAITPFAAAQNAAREFNGTYENIDNNANLNWFENWLKNSDWSKRRSQTVQERINKNLDENKKRDERINNGTATVWDKISKASERAADSYIQSEVEKHQQNEKAQGVNREDKTKRYEVAAFNRVGMPIYREIDLTKKIGFLEASRNRLNYNVPIIGALAEGADDRKLRTIKEHIIKNEPIRQDELDYVNSYVARKQEEITRGYSWQGKIGQGVVDSLGLSADILVGSALGGALGLGAAASRASSIASKAPKIAKAIEWGVNAFGGAGLTVLANPQRVNAQYQERMLGNEMKLTDEGTVIFMEAEEKPATAFFKSLLGTYIMYFAEVGGGSLLRGAASEVGKGLSGVGGTAMKKLIEKNPALGKLLEKTAKEFSKIYEKMNGMPVVGKSTGWLRDRAHFDGLLEEMGEESLEDFLRLTFGIDNEERSLENYSKAVFKSPEEWGIIAGTIILQGGGMSAMSYVLTNKMAEKGASQEEIENVLTSTTEGQKVELVKEMVQDGTIDLQGIDSKDEDEKEQIKEDWYNKLSDIGVKKDVAFAASELMGNFKNNFGSGSKSDAFNKWYNKLEVTNKPLKHTPANMSASTHIDSIQTVNQAIQVIENDTLPSYEDAYEYTFARSYIEDARTSNEMYKKLVDNIEREFNKKLDKAKTDKTKDKLNKEKEENLQRAYDMLMNTRKTIVNRLKSLGDEIDAKNPQRSETWQKAEKLGKNKYRINIRTNQGLQSVEGTLHNVDGIDVIVHPRETDWNMDKYSITDFATGMRLATIANKKDIKNLTFKNVIDTYNEKIKDYETINYFQEKNNADVNSPEFKKWFGDSKVVDENGNPLVVYHGSPTSDIEIFDSNKSNYGHISAGFIFFTNIFDGNNESARFYAAENGQVYPCYLSIKNPLEYNATGWKDGNFEYKTPVQFFDMNSGDIKREYRKGNYDGIIITVGDESIYVVADNTQIKSVNNQGTFDAENPNIYFQSTDTAGADKGEEKKAEKEWKEKGTKSKFFKKWFGKSKIKNAEGKPIKVFHGSLWEFNAFEKGGEYNFSFSPKFAHEYAAQKSFEQALDLSPVLYEAYLKVEKPFDFRNEKQVDELLEKIGDNEIRFFGTTFTKEKFKDDIMGYAYVNTVYKQEDFDKAKIGMAYSDMNYNVEEHISSVARDKIVFKNKKYFIAAKELHEPDVNWFDRENRYYIRDKKAVYSKLEKIAKTLDFGEEHKKTISIKTEQVKKESAWGEKGWYIKEDVKPYDLEVTLVKVDNPKLAKKEGGYDNWLTLEGTMIGDKYFVEFLKDNGFDGYYKQEKDQLNIAVFNSNQIKSSDNQGTFDANNTNIYLQEKENEAANKNVIDWTDKFDKVPTFKEIEEHIRDIIKSGQVFDTLSPDWKIDIKGGNRVVDKITNKGNFQKLQNSAKKRHNKYVQGIEELINNASYDHSDINKKQDKKPNVLQYHYFNVNVKIGDNIYSVSLECEETKNVPQGNYAKHSSKSHWNNNNVEQTNDNVKIVHLYNIKETGKTSAVNPELDNKNNNTKYKTQFSLKDIHENIRVNKLTAEREYYGYFSESEEKNILAIMQDANPSTVIHEMGHLFLNGLNEMAKIDDDAKQQLDEINQWLGATDGKYTKNQAEKFALSFEAYLYKGKAPSNKLRHVFENFREWLKNVYENITKLEIKGADISKEVQEMFDRIFSDTNEYTAEQKEINKLLNRITNIGLSGEYKDMQHSQEKHKEAAYSILAKATGKTKKYLKSILENINNADEQSITEIERLIQNANLKTENGTYPEAISEWLQYFDNPELYTAQDDTLLAAAAYNAIKTKTYKIYLNKYDFINDFDAQYKSIIDNFKRAAAQQNGNITVNEEKRSIVLGAFYEWLENIKPEFRDIFAEKFVKDTAYIERFEKMDKFARARETILNKAKSLQKPYSINSVEEYKDVVVETMKSLNFLHPEDKAKLVANILDYSSLELLKARIDNILDIAKTMEDVAYRENLMNEIHSELQGTKNVKKGARTVGKYDYSTNKLFEQLRELDKLTVEEANDIRLNNKKLIDAEDAGLSFADKLINKFLTYKANGNQFADTQHIKSLYDDIIKIKLAGKEAKNERELIEALNDTKEIDELVEILKSKKEAKGLVKFYNNVLCNLESCVNTIFNEKIKQKYATEIFYSDLQSQAWQFHEKKKFEDAVAKIYNLPQWCWDKEIIKNLATKIKVTEHVREYDEEGEIIASDYIDKEMTKMDCLLAYIWDKNDVLHQRLANMFGEDGLDIIFGELSPQDEQLGDLMMKTVNSYYPMVNEMFIKKYGLDMPKVSCYFPSTPERGSEIDLLNDYSAKSLNNSFTKARSGSDKIAMVFSNPVAIMYNHIDGVAKFVMMSEQLDKANKILKNGRVIKHIKNKFGNDAFRTLEQALANVSYKANPLVFNGYDKILHAIVGNWIQGNVAFKPIVGLKQLLSASNYAVDMPILTWTKGFISAVKDFKGTIDYMMKIPYINARFKGSNANEFLKSTIENSAFATSKKLKELFGVFIKTGDIGAIMFGGKPYIDYLINEKGMSEDAAIKQFLLSTNRSQQSSVISSLSNMQVSMSKHPFAKLFIAYKNTPHQYARMCGDAIVSVANGDMTKEQCAKVLFNYLFFQPFLYEIATSGAIFKLLLTGDWDDVLEDLYVSIFDLAHGAFPFLGDVYKTALDTLVFKKGVLPQQTPLLGDLQNEILKIAKEDADFEDYMHFVGYGAFHIGLGYNLNAVTNSAMGVVDVTQGDYIKGLMRFIGYTENRAKKIAGEKD